MMPYVRHIVRTATMHDTEAVAALQAACHPPDSHFKEPLAVLASVLSEGRSLVCVDRAACNAVVGFVLCHATEQGQVHKQHEVPALPSHATGWFYIRDTCVHPGSQGKGIGRLLVSTLLHNLRCLPNYMGVEVAAVNNGTDGFWSKMFGR